MQRMNPTDGHNMPYWWSGLLIDVQGQLILVLP